jgi:hypothetical protein
MESMTINELKVELKKKGLKMGGNKAELIERLKNHGNAPKQTKPKKAKKKTIPKALRDAVWVNEMGKNYDGKCYACQKQVDITTFDCAHILAEANGGETILTNLKITCKPCNLSCGTNNLDDFKEKFKKENNLDDFKEKFKKENNVVNMAKHEFVKDKQYKYNLIHTNSKHDTNSAPCVMMRIRKIIDCYPIFEQWYSNYEKMNKTNYHVKIINPDASQTFFFSIEENEPDPYTGSTYSNNTHNFMKFDESDPYTGSTYSNNTHNFMKFDEPVHGSASSNNKYDFIKF